MNDIIDTDYLIESIEDLSWGNYLKKMCDNLYQSMPNRVRKVYEMNCCSYLFLIIFLIIYI